MAFIPNLPLFQRPQVTCPPLFILQRLRSWLQPLLLICLILVSFNLSACNRIVPSAGLKPYVDVADGYQFLYPNGWLEVKTSGVADVLFRDLINPTENVSVILSPVGDDRSLEDLGTPGQVGYVLQKNAIAPPNSGIRAELVDARRQEMGDQTYYLLEYEVTLDQEKRHNLSSVVVNRGYLYTFSLSSTEARWSKVKDLFETVVNSFSVS